MSSRRPNRETKAGFLGIADRNEFKDIYHENPPKDRDMIKIKIRPEVVALLTFLFPHCVAVVSFMLFIMEGRYAGYVPTISETGTEYPNSMFFALAMATGGLMIMISIYMYTCYARMKFDIPPPLLNFMRVLTVTSGFGTAGLGFAPINEVHHRHVFFAGTGFASILIFEGVVYHLAKNHITMRMRIFRVTSIVIAVAGMVLFVTADWFLDHRFNVTVSTIGEYALLFFMQLGILSWRSELNSLEIYAVLL